ncbi:MAG: sulfatase [Sphingobacteriales bacterium]
MQKVIYFTISFFFNIALLNAQSSSKLPNIVLILMDDMGFGDLSCYGAADINTPNLDKLASEGIRFTNFVTSQAVCSASRSSLLTGCYANRLGISGALMPRSPIGLSHDETTIPELLKQKNYATAAYGKWHLGDHKTFLPRNHGFDEYFGIPYSNDMWPIGYDGKPAMSNTNKASHPPLPLIDGEETITTLNSLEQQSVLTGLLTDKAISFIERNKKLPFFIYLAHPMPHVPISTPDAFRGKSKQGLYGDVIQEVDANVGRMVKKIKQLGLDKNTLFIFTSDNGPWLNFGNHAGSTGGFREGKGTTFEGGHRVPCIMRWKDEVPAGLVLNQLASTLDIFTTIASITGASLPNKKIDGVYLYPLIKGDLTQKPRDEFYYYYRKNSLEAVRKENWKLVFQHPSRSYINQIPGKDGLPGPAPENIIMATALYDLTSDPFEKIDLKEKFPEIVKILEAIAEKARQDLGDELQNRIGDNVRSAGKIGGK